MTLIVYWLQECIIVLQDELLQNTYFRAIIYMLFTCFVGGFVLELIFSLALSIKVKKLILFNPVKIKEYKNNNFYKAVSPKNQSKLYRLFHIKRYNPYANKSFRVLQNVKSYSPDSIKMFRALQVARNYYPFTSKNYIARASAKAYSLLGYSSLKPLLHFKTFGINSVRYFNSARLNTFFPASIKNIRVSEFKYFGLNSFKSMSVMRSNLGFKSVSEFKQFVSTRPYYYNMKNFNLPQYKSLAQQKYYKDLTQHNMQMFYKTHPGYKPPKGVKVPGGGSAKSDS